MRMWAKIADLYSRDMAATGLERGMHDQATGATGLFHFDTSAVMQPPFNED